MKVVIRGKEMESYFSLADRKELEFPVLRCFFVEIGNAEYLNVF